MDAPFVLPPAPVFFFFFFFFFASFSHPLPGFGQYVAETFEPTLSIDFSSVNFTTATCTYELGVEIVFETSSYNYATDMTTFVFLFLLSVALPSIHSPFPTSSLTWSQDIPTPLITFNTDESTCGATGGKGGENGERGGGYFVLNPVESLSLGFEVVSVEWTQVQGPEVVCEDSASFQCGGSSNTFLSIPASSLSPCTTYQWEATVNISDGTLSSSSTVSLCEAEFLAAPSGGECYASYGEGLDCGFPLQTVEIFCRYINLFFYCFLIIFF